MDTSGDLFKFEIGPLAKINVFTLMGGASCLVLSLGKKH